MSISKKVCLSCDICGYEDDYESWPDASANDWVAVPTDDYSDEKHICPRCSNRIRDELNER